VDTYRRNMQRAYLQQAHYLLHEAESDTGPAFVGQPAGQQQRRPAAERGPAHRQSDIRPLVREQLVLLRGEIRDALGRGIRDRMTRVHLEDALVRIEEALTGS
jgi:hypothetical protein